MRIAASLLALGALTACEKHGVDTSLSSDASRAAGDTFAMIASDTTGEKVKLWLSSGTRDKLGLCQVLGTETCSKTHATYAQATLVFQKNGRRILAFNDQIAARTDRTYVVVADDGAVELKFHLKTPNNGGGGLDPLTDGIALIKKETLREELTYITRDELKGRLSATPENDQVAGWLADHLKNLGIEPGTADYRQPFRLGVGPTASGTTNNIVGKIEGTDPDLKKEWIILGAHMDHAGSLSRGYTCSQGSIAGDTICNGADDNGSGTIAVLNVAKALAGAKGKMKRSVMIIWFSGEEEGLIGSNHYVRSPIVPLAQTVYMVNMDMVGYMRSFGNQLAALGGGSSRTGKQILQDIAKKYPSTPLQISDKAGGGSDHAPFMAKGIPGVFFHTGVSNNPNYHKTSDHVDKIDFDGMTVAAKVAFETVYLMANADKTASYTGSAREPLVSDEELAQSCHHLIKNPFIQELSHGLDFTNGNGGQP